MELTLYETFIGVFKTNDIIGMVLSGFLWLIILFVAGLIIYGLVMLVDYAFLFSKYDIGKITNKNYTEPYDETTVVYDPATKTSRPSTTHHPACYLLIISVAGKTGEFEVSKNYYNKCSISQQVNVRYSIGRLFGTLYVKDVDII